MNSLIQHSACTLSKMIKEKTVSAVEVAQAFIDQISKVNPIINAIHQVDPERILAQAKLADKKIAEKKPLGKLHGVPISVKNSIHVKDFIFSKGSYLLLGKPSEKNGTVVERMLAEGAIILGISNVPEFLSAYETDNLIHGRTNNPYDLSKTPGGSSGGEAAIIAAGGSPLGIGSDAGGSIRVPAHYTGICGIKPTKGLVPITGDTPADAPGLIGQLICIGPMARYVEDLILSLPIMAGPDNYDPTIAPVPVQDPYQVDLKKLKVGYFTDNSVATPTPETISAINNVIKELKDSVHSLQEKSPPAQVKRTYDLVWETFFSKGDGGKMLDELLSSMEPDKISPLFQSFFDRVKATKFSTYELHQRLYEIDHYRASMMEYMRDFDVLLCPVTATPAIPHGTSRQRSADFTYSMMFNLTGWPSTVVRCGTSKEGLPIGVQVVAKSWNDHLSLAVAHKIQQMMGVSEIVDVNIGLHTQSD